MKLTDDEITRVRLLKYDTWSKITRWIRRSQLRLEFENKDISMGMYKSFVDLMYYYHKYKPGKAKISSLDDDIFDNEDMDDFEKFYIHYFSPHQKIFEIAL